MISIGIQVCCTSEAIYSLTKLPFYSIAFHLLTQGQLDDALETVSVAEETPPPGLDPEDLVIYARRIRMAAVIISIGQEQFDRAHQIACVAEADWNTVLALLQNNYQILEDNPIEVELPKKFEVDKKYTNRCTRIQAQSFIEEISMSRIEESIDPTNSVLFYFQMLLENDSSSDKIYTTIRTIVSMGISNLILEQLVGLIQNRKRTNGKDVTTWQGLKLYI